MTEAEDLNNGHYFLDKSQVELERLNLGQFVIMRYMKKPVWAPLDLSQHCICILDSGAANGKWIQDLRDSLPVGVRESSTFVTTDVTDVYFPDPRPDGITFRVQSMLQDWPAALVGSFDLVHQRMALPAANKTEVHRAIGRFTGLLKPGGWIQLVEGDHSVAKGPAMADFFRLLSDLFAVMNTGSDYARHLKTWLADLGFEDVQEKVFDIPLGAGNEDEEVKEKSTRMFDYGVRGLIDVAQTVPTSLTKDELETLEHRMHEENMTTGGIFRLHCVWGRKPPESLSR